MNARLPKYVPLFLLSALVVTACGDTGNTSPTAPSGLQHAMITAEPSTVGPEFVRGDSCLGFAPFGARLTFIVRPRGDITVRSARFHFIDRFGVRTVPAVTPPQITPSALPATPFSTPVPMPSSPPIPMPASSAIPIPGVSQFDPLVVLGGSSLTLPFLVQFGCGVPPDGTVFVDFDLRDRRGVSSTSHVRVRIRD